MRQEPWRGEIPCTNLTHPFFNSEQFGSYTQLTDIILDNMLFIHVCIFFLYS
jgi:hypothetical protein